MFWHRFSLRRIFTKRIRKLADSGHYKKALRLCERLLTLYPNSPKVHCELGFLYLCLGMPDVSLFHSHKAISLFEGDDFGPIMNGAIAHIHLQRPLLAVQYFNRAEELKDQVPMVEYGKLLMFRAEARRDIVKRGLTNKPVEQISFAMQDLNAGEYVFMECDNDTADFWIKQILGRRKDIESLRDIRLTDIGRG